MSKKAIDFKQCPKMILINVQKAVSTEARTKPRTRFVAARRFCCGARTSARPDSPPGCVQTVLTPRECDIRNYEIQTTQVSLCIFQQKGVDAMKSSKNFRVSPNPQLGCIDIEYAGWPQKNDTFVTF